MTGYPPSPPPGFVSSGPRPSPLGLVLPVGPMPPSGCPEVLPCWDLGWLEPLFRVVVDVDREVVLIGVPDWLLLVVEKEPCPE